MELSSDPSTPAQELLQEPPQELPPLLPPRNFVDSDEIEQAPSPSPNLPSIQVISTLKDVAQAQFDFFSSDPLASASEIENFFAPSPIRKRPRASPPPESSARKRVPTLGRTDRPANLGSGSDFDFEFEYTRASGTPRASSTTTRTAARDGPTGPTRPTPGADRLSNNLTIRPTTPNLPNSTLSNNLTIPSFASIANQGSKASDRPQEWTLVGRKPKQATPPKSERSSPNRLIVTQTPGTTTSFSPLAARNALNKAFTDKGIKGPVVISVNLNRSAEATESALQLAVETKVDILLVQELWLVPGNTRSVLHPGYTQILPKTHLRPRTLAYIARGFRPSSCIANTSPNDPDLLVLDISEANATIQLLNIYNEQDLGDSGLRTVNRVLYPRALGPNTVLAGDLNIHHPWWDPVAPTTSPGAEELVDWIESNSLELLNTPGIGTFFRPHMTRESVLDLTLVSPSLASKIQDWIVLPDLGSDHYGINFTIAGNTRPLVDNLSLATAYNTDLADWAILEEEESSITILLDEASKELTKAVTEAADLSIPKRKVGARAKPWWNDSLKELRQKMIRNQRTFIRYSYNYTAKRDYLIAKNAYFLAIKQAKRSHWNDFLEKEDPKTIFKAMAYTRDRQIELIPPIQASTNPEHLESSFAGKCSAFRSTLFPPPPEAPKPTWNSYTPSNKLFSALIDVGYHLTCWKQATGAILKKLGKPNYTLPKAYRVISLLNCLGKVSERILAQRLGYLAETTTLLHPSQVGGRLKKSAIDAALLFNNEVEIGLKQKQKTSALLLDVKGAFDHVAKNQLLSILKDLRLPTSLASWVQSFLSNRLLRLAFDGQIEQFAALNTGIPQGSPISPILFLIYIRGLFTGIVTARPLSYIDDIALIVTTPNYTSNIKILEREAARLFDQGAKSAIQFDLAKTELIHFGPSKAKLRLPDQTRIEPKQLVRWRARQYLARPDSDSDSASDSELNYTEPTLAIQLDRITSSISRIVSYSYERIQHFQFPPWARKTPYSVEISQLPKEEEALAYNTLISIPNTRITHVYSDASYIPDSIGVGVVNIGAEQLVYNGELEGVTQAIEYISSIAIPRQKYRIYSDNQAGLHRLKTPSDNPGQDCQIRAIQATEAAIQKGASIELAWVPGHTDIEGNELADRLAKRATLEEPSSNSTSFAYLGMKIKAIRRAEWLSYLTNYTTNKPNSNPNSYTRKFIWKIGARPLIPPNTKRETASAFYQLKLGHGYLKSYLFRLDRSNSDLCRCGLGPHCPQTILTLNLIIFGGESITFMEKADELRSEFGYDIYVLGRRNGKLVNYTSKGSSRDGPSWPLSLTEVDQSYPRPERYTPASFLKRGTKSLLCEGRKGRDNPMVRTEDLQTGDITGAGG
ncbi:uncharacterized protein BP5553_02392 [Venustampulla echinocandica]|uniref:Reverse transcriptase n=1 Tax=Venustampulla echinocandica TaxID=2656787 RepID=A0A370U3U3_9HELO|nr:uncharacterized protein BP5553_02392 [Venustampulla echinocandica]RDL42413.1 hypothetical protein BP5553_02392 [Venustampulla echinocandica]